MKNVLISTSIWYDMQALPSMTKLVYMYLLVNDRIELSGVYRFNKNVIAAEINISIEEVTKAIDELIRLSLIFTKDDYVIVPLIFNTQSHSNFKIKKAITTRISSLPQKISQWFLHVMHDQCIAYQYPIDEMIPNGNSNNNSNQNKYKLNVIFNQIEETEKEKERRKREDENDKYVELARERINKSVTNLSCLNPDEEEEEEIFFWNQEEMRKIIKERNNQILNELNNIIPGITFDEIPPHSEIGKIYASLLHASTGKSPSALYAACMRDFRLSPIMPKVDPCSFHLGIHFWDVEQIIKDGVNYKNSNWLEIKKYQKSIKCPICQNGKNIKIKKSHLKIIEYINTHY